MRAALAERVGRRHAKQPRTRVETRPAPRYNGAVVVLPPVLGKFTRTRVLVLVAGRTALARVGGIASVARHVATARRLGFDPIVIYPARMRALGAEIAGELNDETPCVPSADFVCAAGEDDALVLVIAGDWYVSPQAVVAFNDHTSGTAVARFEERGRWVAPVARMRCSDVRAVVARLEDGPPAELILSAADAGDEVVPLLVSERHRLSDNVAVEHCEDKLFASLGEGDEPWHVALLHDFVSIPMARRLARTRTTPAEIAAAKIVLGLGAAWMLTAGGYRSAVLAAALLVLSRILDAISADLARAAVRESPQNDRFDLAGDLAVQLAVVWAIAYRLGTTTATVLAAVASAGILVSAAVSYLRVFRRVWDAQARGERHDVPRANYGARFARRNGPAYGLLAAALLGRLDLFLWAAALVGHLFYLGWLRAKEPSTR
jgi:hypothetical protein